MKEPLLDEKKKSYSPIKKSDSKKILEFKYLKSMPLAVLKQHVYTYLTKDELFQLSATCLSFYGRYPNLVFRNWTFSICCRTRHPDFSKAALKAPNMILDEKRTADFFKLKAKAENMVEKGYYCVKLADVYKGEDNDSKTLYWLRRGVCGSYGTPGLLADLFKYGIDGAVRDPKRGKLSYWMEYGYRNGAGYTEDTFARRFYKGEEGFEQDYKKAAYYYELYVQKYPNKFFSKSKLADCYERLGDLNKARDLYIELAENDRCTNDEIRNQASNAISRITNTLSSNQSSQCLCM